MLNINKPSGYTRVGRLVIGGLAVFIPLATAAPHTSLANSNVPAGVCNLMPGLQGRIESISNERGAQKLIQIERAGHTYVVDIGCFLIAGDTVKPGPGNSALVRLPDGTTTLAEFSRPITISSLNPPGTWRVSLARSENWSGLTGEMPRRPLMALLEYETSTIYQAR